MKLRIEVNLNTDNSAFDEDPAAEVARILRGMTDRIEQQHYTGGTNLLFDINGNACGYFQVTERDDE